MVNQCLSLWHNILMVVGRLEHRLNMFWKKVTKCESRDLSETFQPHVETARIKQRMPFIHPEFRFVYNSNRSKGKTIVQMHLQKESVFRTRDRHNTIKMSHKVRKSGNVRNLSPLITRSAFNYSNPPCFWA